MCDELKEYYYYEDRVITPATHMYRVYHADEVDTAIEELKARIQLDDDEMAGFLQLEEEFGVGDLRNYIAELKQKLAEKDAELESLKASHYAEMVDADENLRWRKTSEEIPSENDYYLVSDGKNVFMEYGSYNEQDEVWNWDHGENMDTWKYWRPMPKAPEEAK